MTSPFTLVKQVQSECKSKFRSMNKNVWISSDRLRYFWNGLDGWTLISLSRVIGVRTGVERFVNVMLEMSRIGIILIEFEWVWIGLEIFNND
jgi:hypothetical protein